MADDESKTSATPAEVRVDAEETEAPTKEVYFEFDSARIGEDTSARLAEIVEWSSRHPDAKIVVDGHADPVGTDVYNVGLSARRAESVQARLIAMGVPANRIYMGIYGENDIRRPTHALDRRVTVHATEQPLYALVDETLVRGIAIMWNEPVTAAEIDGPRATDVMATRE